MAGWFDLIKSNGRQFRFVLKAANGETILTSKLYTTKRAAEIGIASVQTNSSLDDRYVLKNSFNSRFYFKIRAANNHIIGKSQMYTTSKSRDIGIASVKENGSTEIVKNNT
ncbi:YegP family protein [Salmonella enterica]|nr:YegP family protein [Salmonella enterica]EJX4924027.1 YegP family protein [Salmonella enterica]EKQ0892891.1 YegP family protein [Salmonella enterica]